MFVRDLYEIWGLVLMEERDFHLLEFGIGGGGRWGGVSKG